MKYKTRIAGEGFTLIEIAVATFILVVLVLILAQIFHQSSVAWSAGIRRANGNMTGRSSMALLARELMNAAVDSNVLKDVHIRHAANYLEFPCFIGENAVGVRAVRLVRYELVSNGGKYELKRNEVAPLQYGYWPSFDPAQASLLVTNVAGSTGFFIQTPSGQNYTDTENIGQLPAWLRIRLVVGRDADISRIGALSYGPDRVLGTPDDISSY